MPKNTDLFVYSVSSDEGRTLNHLFTTRKLAIESLKMSYLNVLAATIEVSPMESWVTVTVGISKAKFHINQHRVYNHIEHL